MNPFKSFRKWVRSYMLLLEDKDELSLKDIFLSNMFRLIAKLLKCISNFVSTIKILFDFKRRRIVKIFTHFLSLRGSESVAITYTKDISESLQSSTELSTVISIISGGFPNGYKLVNENLLQISKDSFFKYYKDLMDILSKRTGFYTIFFPDMDSAKLLVDFNAMKYKTISNFVPKQNNSVEKFVFKNSLKNI